MFLALSTSEPASPLVVTASLACRYTGTRSMWTPAASAKALRSPGSEVRMSSPSAARQTSAASTASSVLLRPRSTPAFLPKSWSRGFTSTPASRRPARPVGPNRPARPGRRRRRGSAARAGRVARVHQCDDISVTLLDGQERPSVEEKAHATPRFDLTSFLATFERTTVARPRDRRTASSI